MCLPPVEWLASGQVVRFAKFLSAELIIVQHYGYGVCDSPDYFYNTMTVLAKDMGLAVVSTKMHEFAHDSTGNL
jgi:hypothetical protein